MTQVLSRNLLHDQLLDAMRSFGDGGEYLQRVYDCLFEDGKETDIETDLDRARTCALAALHLAEMLVEVTPERLVLEASKPPSWRR